MPLLDSYYKVPEAAAIPGVHPGPNGPAPRDRQVNVLLYQERTERAWPEGLESHSEANPGASTPGL